MPVLSVMRFIPNMENLWANQARHINTQHRYWHHAGMKNSRVDGRPSFPSVTQTTSLGLRDVRYDSFSQSREPVNYYRAYTAKTFNISSVIEIVEPEQLVNSSVKVTMKPSHLIESFAGDWEKAWFTYRPNEWARSTHKLYHKNYRPPSQNANLSIEVMAAEENELVILLDDYAAVVPFQVETIGEQFTSLSTTLKIMQGIHFPIGTTSNDSRCLRQSGCNPNVAVTKNHG